MEDFSSFDQWPGHLYVQNRRTRKRIKTFITCTNALEGFNSAWCHECRRKIGECEIKIQYHDWSNYWKQLIKENKIPDPLSLDRSTRLKILAHILPLLEKYRKKQEIDDSKKRPVSTMWKAIRDYWRSWLEWVSTEDPSLLEDSSDTNVVVCILRIPFEVERLLAIWTRLNKLKLIEIEDDLRKVIKYWQQNWSDSPKIFYLIDFQASQLQFVLRQVEKKISDLIIDRQFNGEIEILWNCVETKLRRDIGLYHFRQFQKINDLIEIIDEKEHSTAPEEMRLGGRAAKSKAILQRGEKRKTSHFNYRRLQKYSPRIDELRSNPILNDLEKAELNSEFNGLIRRITEAEVLTVGAQRLLIYNEANTPKAKKLKRWKEEAEPLLLLREDLKQHFSKIVRKDDLEPEILGFFS